MVFRTCLQDGYAQASGDWNGEDYSYYNQGYDNGCVNGEPQKSGATTAASVNPSDYTWYPPNRSAPAYPAAEYYPAYEDGYVYDYDVAQVRPPLVCVMPARSSVAPPGRKPTPIAAILWSVTMVHTLSVS